MKLILIRGLPGTGKSTLAQRLTIERRWWYEADHYFYRGWKGQGPYYFDPVKLKDAHEWCQRRVKEHMREEAPLLVVSNTFSTWWEIRPYFDLAKTYQYDTTVIKLVGMHGSVHEVPEETIDKMVDRWEDWPEEIVFEGCGIK